jgi:acylphosphatase
MSEDPLSRLHVHLAGRVQGVGFRYFVQRAATQLAVTGWVRNRWDGGVEVVAEGPRPQLDELLETLRRGPTGAQVTTVQPGWQTATGEYPRFTIRRTG